MNGTKNAWFGPMALMFLLILGTGFAAGYGVREIISRRRRRRYSRAAWR
jgi:hypothetical protein